jgi:hypothetical protein
MSASPKRVSAAKRERVGVQDAKPAPKAQAESHKEGGDLAAELAAMTDDEILAEAAHLLGNLVPTSAVEIELANLKGDYHKKR